MTTKYSVSKKFLKVGVEMHTVSAISPPCWMKNEAIFLNLFTTLSILISKELKHRETYSKFPTRLLKTFPPCTGFHNKHVALNRAAYSRTKQMHVALSFARLLQTAD